MINWKELNYAKGIERIFDVIWIGYSIFAVAAITWTLIRWGPLSLSHKEYITGATVIVLPYFIKRGLKLLLPWLWKGFTSQ